MVYFPKLSAAALLLPLAASAPVAKRQAALTDADILQFALTLEHLENVFYKEGLAQFPESAFLAAGYTSEYYNNLKYIAYDEEQHVKALTQGLQEAGAQPVAAGTYNFGFTDPKSFVTIASVLEGVGSAAYLGAAPAIQSKEYLTIAGSILVTEAIHTSIQRYALGEVAPANPYGSYITPNSAYTLAASFITSLPPTNAKLPFTAFPGLTAVQGIPAAPGITFQFTTETAPPAGSFVTFVNGLVTMSSPATISGNSITAAIPATVSGQTYAYLTSSSVTMLADSNVVAGPAVIEVTPNAPAYDPTYYL